MGVWWSCDVGFGLGFLNLRREGSGEAVGF